MTCLFGYCGFSDMALLPRMAGLLAHRCRQGWAQAEGRLGDATPFALGCGLASWQPQDSLVQSATGAMAYTGMIFRPQAQASRLLGILAADPEGQLPQLDGAYALGLATSEAFYLVRDHGGNKALYWTLHRGRLLFASEIKALFADPQVPRCLRPGALPEYLSFSFIPGERTMFDNIFELQPGTWLRFAAGKVELQRHFRFEEQEAHAAAERDHVACLRQTLFDSVQDCITNSSTTPGVFLSGGIDSSSVLATAATLLPDTRIPTFSVHFGADYPNENPFIEQMVQRYHTEHHALEIRAHDFIDELREIVWRLDEPIGDPVAMPNYLLARQAASVTDIILNGEGGDPCLGGPKNVPMLLAKLYGPHPAEVGSGWLERQYLHSFQRCYQDLQELLNPDVLHAAGGIESLEEILQPFFDCVTPRHFLNKLMAMNIRLKGANLILVKVDKMTSAHGLLALAPLFSKAIIEAAMACPPPLKLDGAIEKSVLKQAMADLVPQTIIDRPKSGMQVPVSFWFRGELRRYGKQLLSPRRLKRNGLFNPRYVHKLLNYDRGGVPGMRHGLKLWMLITLLLWHEQMVESTPAAATETPALVPRPVPSNS